MVVLRSIGIGDDHMVTVVDAGDCLEVIRQNVCTSSWRRLLGVQYLRDVSSRLGRPFGMWFTHVVHNLFPPFLRSLGSLMTRSSVPIQHLPYFTFAVAPNVRNVSLFLGVDACA